MSVSTIKRGVRGRGRGGYRPIRRPTMECSNTTDDEMSKKSESTKEIKELSSAPVESVSTPDVSATEQRFSSPSQQRKLANIFNIAKQSCITQVETCKLFEQLKVSTTNDSSKVDDDNNDGDDTDEKIRCEFCASLDHLTRNCIIFNNKSSSSTILNACYNCKESGHYRNQCPKRGNNSYRGQSFRSVKMYGPRNNIKFPDNNIGWSTKSHFTINSDDEEIIGNTTIPIAKAQQQSKSKRINVPMPVPASSIKPTIQLRSKLKSLETAAAGKQAIAEKSPSKSSYIRSDTESDEFSSSSGEENTREVNSKSNAKMSSSNITSVTDSSQRSAVTKSCSNVGKKLLKMDQPMKDKFNLSVLEQIIRTLATPTEFVKRTFEIRNYSQSEKHFPPSKSGPSHSRSETEGKRLRLSDILYPTKSQPNEDKETNEEVQVSETNKGKIKSYSEDDDKELSCEDIKVANEPENLGNMTQINDEVECSDADSKTFVLCDNEILSEPDDNSSQVNADIELYGCDGAILSENDSELAEKASPSCSTTSSEDNKGDNIN